MTTTLSDLGVNLDPRTSNVTELVPKDKAQEPPVPRFFDDFIKAYLEFTRGQEASEKIHKWVATSIIAAALERKVWLNRGHYILYPNLYTIIVGASGLVRKSTSTGIGVELLRSLDKFSAMSERVTAASLITQLARAGREFSDYKGAAHKHSAVFCYASELKVFLDDVFGDLKVLLTTFYDCHPNDWRTPWVYENKGEGITRVHGPCLNILGASTPTWLVKCIPPSEMEGGFASRVIFVVENDTPERFIAWPRQDDQTMKSKLASDLARIHEMSGEFIVSPEAHLWFEAWYREHMLNLSKVRDPRFSGYFGRKGDTILKIAMSLSASESSSYLIEERHIREAADSLTALEASMYDAFGAAGDNSQATVLRKIWASIRSAKEIRHIDLLKAHWRDVSHKDLIPLVEMLRQMGAVKILSDGGRVIYQVKDEHVRL